MIKASVTFDEPGRHRAGPPSGSNIFLLAGIMAITPWTMCCRSPTPCMIDQVSISLYVYDLFEEKNEQIYNLRIHYKSWLVICRQKMVRVEQP